MGAGAQPLLDHGALQQVLGVGAQLAVLADLARAHLRVGVDSLLAGVEALQLHLARCDHALCECRPELSGTLPLRSSR